MDNALSKLIENRDKRESDLISRAYEFAKSAHSGQKRESGEDYFTHPCMTAIKLNSLNSDAETIVSALLHDVVDDTPITLNQIKKEFGVEIAKLVEGVSKLGKAKYHGLERHAENLKKLFLAMNNDIRVALIKLADRSHNIETIHSLPVTKQLRIAQETLEIYAPIANRLGMGQIKGELETLSFPIAHPDAYKKITEIYNNKKEAHSQYATEASQIIKQQLIKNSIEITDLQGRVKHIYSFFKKLKKYHGDASLIYDIIAIRIIVPEIKDCYSTLGIIHNIWKPLPNKIKDYIAMPKVNGYKSLHTTVFGPDQAILEIQIRTPEMHNEAESGIAAHWAYDDKKDKVFTSKANEQHLNKNVSWTAQLVDMQNKEPDNNAFLKNVKFDFFSDRIFVLTPRGEVIDLPEGSTPLDFAFKIHSDIGSRYAGAMIDQKIVPLNYHLKNGEIVKILTKEHLFPKRSWLDIVYTNEAKHKIRSVLRKMGEKIEIKKPVLQTVKKTAEANPVVKKTLSKSSEPLITIGGQTGLSIRIAKCCNPDNSSENIGYVSKAGSINIHKKNCPNLRNRDTRKIIQIEWL
ncbi:bifunctional (p)ppGpp synthetase/guanosine-3',5'-bis(diphosphate) 3'-pyrophosphohydrolase [bacterium]|nr:MAG: bifunctional (p)ppGpp synthetase/guanosine-3',5'-bis(diphosphate) 3'-pyrophosphohydrolase [bacterium]